MRHELAGMATEASRQSAPLRSRKVIYLAPALVFLVASLFFLWGLNPKRNPSEVPSALIGRIVPDFSLPPVAGRAPGLSSGDLKGEVSLLNVFASWCAECRREHPLMMRLQKDGVVPIYGLNYKDKPEDARGWLDGLGDPYTRTGADLEGRVAIDLGVYGVPETFVIDRDGRIAHKHIGAMSPQALAETILPLIESLRRQVSRGAS